jgi:hypothetical protein
LDQTKLCVFRSKKSSKVGKAKAKVSQKMLPKVIGLGAPKEVVPLVITLRQRKKQGEDISGVVTACLAALGT